jgi:hypothetical protein
MEKLPEEYIDIKSVRHRVEHLTLLPDEQPQRERILEELTLALTKPKKTSG